jgi:glycosyltransferase involved in cell wall biosynthesis
MTSSSPPPWVLVCGGFHQHGGMDQANRALARILLQQRRTVHLVAHEIDPELSSESSVQITRVARPLNSILLGERALRNNGLRVAREVTSLSPSARVVVNGGNCHWPDINWVHSVHSVWPALDENAPVWFRAKSRFNKRKARHDERAAFQHARFLIANSKRTFNDLQRIGISSDRIRTIYLGTSPEWLPASAEAKTRARSSLQIATDAKVIAFIGALGFDRNKGFDTLLSAIGRLGLPDLHVLAAGGGRGLHYWQAQVHRANLATKVRLLGFTKQIDQVYAASDLLVSPVRYEAFGLNVQEAICRGVPAIVTASAGVAELYPRDLQHYLLPDSEDVDRLAAMIRNWHVDPETACKQFEAFGAKLRSRTWSDMAEEIISLVESVPARAELVGR